MGAEQSTSLKKYVLQFVILFGSVLVLIYTYLVQNYFFSGLDDAMATNMELVAIRFKSDYLNDTKTALPESGRIRGTWDFSSLPQWLQEQVPSHTHKHRESKILDHCQNGDDCDFVEGTMMSFMAYDITANKRLYITARYEGSEFSQEQIDDWESKMNRSFLISLAPILIVVACAFSLVWRIMQPVRQLAQWTEQLDQHKIQNPPPNLRFAELNLVANHLKDAFDRIREVLEREHRFLRTASHELRTPIAVLSNNLELLDRLNRDNHTSDSAPLQRIRRAVINMKQLTETLLWLSREGEALPAPESVSLDELVKQLIEDNRYLLDDKDVVVEVDSCHCNTQVAATACRIALANLIRNAFQYTSSGKVSILLAPGHVVVSNQNLENTDGKADSKYEGCDYGFGLGIALVEQITKKLGWHYEHKDISGGRRVDIQFGNHEHDGHFIMDKFFWDNAYKENPAHVIVADKILDNVINTLKPTTVLDLGCGSGPNTIKLAASGWKATGVDWSEHAIELANKDACEKHLDANFIVADITQWQPDKNYDLVISTYALPGAKLSKKALHVAAGALAPGGTLIVAEWDPSMANIWPFDKDDMLSVEQITDCLPGLQILTAEVRSISDMFSGDNDPRAFAGQEANIVFVVARKNSAA